MMLMFMCYHQLTVQKHSPIQFFRPTASLSYDTGANVLLTIDETEMLVHLTLPKELMGTATSFSAIILYKGSTT